MLMPTDLPLPSTAPLLPASIIPGPPPVTTANPSSAIILPNLRASSYHLVPSGNLAEPKNETVFLKSAKNCQPSINSEIILKTLQCKEVLKSSSPFFSAFGNFDAG